MHHQLQRCAGYTLLHSTFPELALFQIFACIQHQIPVGLFASLDNTDRYYLPLFFYPDRYYKHPNFDEKHSKCNFKPAKEAIRLQKKFSYVSQLCSFICTYFPENPTLLSRNPDFTQTRENVIPYADRLLTNLSKMTSAVAL